MELEHKGIKYEFWMNVLSQGSFKRTVHVSEGLGNYHYSSILEHLGRASGSMVYDPLRLFQEIIRQTNGTRSFLVYTAGLSQKETIRQACMMQGCNVQFEEVKS
ncbi:MAG: hypothetical protein HUJ58_08715 [Erysipelotrichaceae bacterium]|nr:hypothetical protein [Erysipelotrichaceae bacterium]